MVNQVVKPKRYLVFAGDTYYPSGGWWDLKGTFATKKAAIKLAASFCRGRLRRADWAQVVDTATGAAVYSKLSRKIS